MAATPPRRWQQALGDDRLLVSGFGKWGGGVYDLTTGQPRALDDIPTSGLSLGDDRVWRVLRAPGEQTAACELLSYDARGMRSYQRLDAIRDPHDVCWHDGAVHVSSSWDGIVWRVAPDGTPQPVWRGGTVPDSWHINSLEVVDGRLHVCAFGRSDRHKGWKAGDRDRKSGGFVHDVERGVDVLTGLAHPHAPRRVGDRWYLCESTKGSLTELDAGGKVLRRARVERFSRGLAVVGRWAFVGGNAHRKQPDDRGEIVVVDLEDMQVVERIPMPCLEVYDIVAVPSALARGVALGFGANPARAVEQHRGTRRDAAQRPTPESARLRLVPPRVARTLAAAGQALDRTEARALRVVGRLPDEIAAGEVRTLMVTVENRSSTPIATVVPRTVRIGARWLPVHGRDVEPGGSGGSGTDGDGAGTGAEPPEGGPAHKRALGLMTPLPRLLHPRDSVETEVLFVAPDEPGRYQVRVALHQPGRGWFGRRLQHEVTVLPAVPADSEPARDPAEAALTQS
jgi:hypothetical protein